MSEIPESPVVEFAVREQEAAVSLIVDLIARMEKADQTLNEMADAENDPRLRVKALGVRLCLSYARETLGMVQ